MTLGSFQNNLAHPPMACRICAHLERTLDFRLWRCFVNNANKLGSRRFREGYYPKSALGVFHPMVTSKPPRAQYNIAASLRHSHPRISDAAHCFQ